jgi:transposase-like protein
MGEFPRKADGRRVFTPEFKRRVVQQILKGKKTLAELSREFDIYPTVLRSWKRHYEAGASTAVAANEDVVPASALREAQQRPGLYIRARGRRDARATLKCGDASVRGLQEAGERAAMKPRPGAAPDVSPEASRARRACFRNVYVTGKVTCLRPSAAPLRGLLDRAPVAVQDGSGQRAIGVLTLALAPVKRALAGVWGPQGKPLLEIGK